MATNDDNDSNSNHVESNQLHSANYAHNDPSNDSTSNNATTATATMHEQYVQQQQMIENMKKDIQQQHVLTSNVVPISVLYEQYRHENHNDSNHSNDTKQHSNNFLLDLQQIETRYSHIRMIRGDGNCYYRAFLYSLLESIIQFMNDENDVDANTKFTTTTTSSDMKKEIQRLLEYITKTSWDNILHQGKYDETAIEIFHDEIVDLFTNVIEKKLYCHKTKNTNMITTSTTDDTFHTTMNEENSMSDYCTWYLRLITATYMKHDPDRFLPFILGSLSDTDDYIVDINQYCSKYIEPMGQECDHVHVLALAEAFQIHVTIVYLDGKQHYHEQQVQNKADHPGATTTTTNVALCTHEFGPITSPIQLTLLYRPGHYDILYAKNM